MRMYRNEKYNIITGPKIDRNVIKMSECWREKNCSLSIIMKMTIFKVLHGL